MEIEYNDFLIYADSGCTINNNGYKRMRELYKLLETNDIVAFRIKADCMIINCLRSNISRHYNNAIREIHYTSKSISDFSFF